jgi:hypothetical protein
MAQVDRFPRNGCHQRANRGGVSADFKIITAEDIWKIEPDMMVIGGEVAYSRNH